MSLLSTLPAAAQPTGPVDSVGTPLLWGATIGVVLFLFALDFVLTRHGPAAEMVPTSSGDMPASGEDLGVPGLARREGRWVHEGAFTGAGGRRGRHSEDFVPLWEEMTGLYRAHPGATW